MNKILSIVMVCFLGLVLVGCTKSDAAQNVDNLIHSINEVTLESEAKILEAENAYNALSEAEKEEIENKQDLEFARKKYEELLENKKKEEEQSKIKEVEDAISSLGEITLDSTEILDEVSKKYEELPTELKVNVTNYNDLKNAQNQLKTLKEEKAEDLLKNMRHEEDRVRGLDFYYPKQYRFFSDGSWDAASRCFALPYLGRDKNHTWLRIIYNYTGDDWVFFKKIIFAVDGEQHYKYFNYFDIVHDNGGGDVWEYIDDEVLEADVELLWDIANSKETIVRFEGDNYIHDYTINAADKQAVRDVLTIYELLK